MILLTGGNGQLGTAFRSLLPAARAVARRELDLSRPAGVAATLDAWRPSLLINCAAYTAVDRAEEEEAAAAAINAEAVGVMAAFAATRDIPFVTFSTDYVFDGAGGEPYVESDTPAPINAYGRTKRAGEVLALENHPAGTLLIRTSWLVSGTHPNFIGTMLRLARRGDPFRVVDDQHGCPTIAADLARVTLAALHAGARGLLHLVNPPATTWFDLARATLKTAGMNPDLVEPCPSTDFPRPAARPSYSVLGSERLGKLGLAGLPPWRESLPGVVEMLTR
ncbi:MAG: dTDP-4-dehydrorhamnose reductase [Phycisphaerales bacterium]|nr:dTDP-4-dehydrorhamnose reductase [Phycisphaerales bacterium]